MKAEHLHTSKNVSVLNTNTGVVLDYGDSQVFVPGEHGSQVDGELHLTLIKQVVESGSGSVGSKCAEKHEAADRRMNQHVADLFDSIIRT